VKVDDIRAEVVNHIPAFGDRPELRVADPAFVDPIIARAIAENKDRSEAVRTAQMRLGNALMQPDGIARIEKLVADHYANPEITKTGKVVTVDVGVVAGKIGIARGNVLYLGDSPYLDRGLWITSEISRFLKLGIAKYPDASEYDVKALLPGARKTRPDWKYAYLPSQGIIKITQEDFRSTPYVVKNVGPDLSALTSLSPWDFKVE
jgi:hypothetical protein